MLVPSIGPALSAITPVVPAIEKKEIPEEIVSPEMIKEVEEEIQLTQKQRKEVEKHMKEAEENFHHGDQNFLKLEIQKVRAH